LPALAPLSGTCALAAACRTVLTDRSGLLASAFRPPERKPTAVNAPALDNPASNDAARARAGASGGGNVKWGSVLLVAFASASATAQVTDPDSALAKKLRGIAGTPLALDEAVRLALVHATDVRLAEARARAAEAAVMHEHGAFDPSVFADANWRDEKRP